MDALSPKPGFQFPDSAWADCILDRPGAHAFQYCHASTSRGPGSEVRVTSVRLATSAGELPNRAPASRKGRVTSSRRSYTTIGYLDIAGHGAIPPQTGCETPVFYIDVNPAKPHSVGYGTGIPTMVRVQAVPWATGGEALFRRGSEVNGPGRHGVAHTDGPASSPRKGHRLKQESPWRSLLVPHALSAFAASCWLAPRSAYLSGLIVIPVGYGPAAAGGATGQ